MIFIPKLKIIEPKEEIKMASRFSGEYKIEATNARTGKQRVLADWFPNLILDAGLDRVGISANYYAICYVGSGNSTPTELQTGLDAQVAGTSTRISNSVTNSGAAPYYAQHTVVYRFAQGAAAGNLSEIGVGWATGALFSRALILDGLGNPTTITVLADEFLDVTYRIRLYVPMNDVLSVVPIDGVGTQVLARAAAASSTSAWLNTSDYGPLAGGNPQGAPVLHYVYSGTIGSITGSPGGTTGGASSMSNAAYTPGTLYRDWSVTWGINAGNVGGVRSAMVYQGADGTFGRTQFQFDPVIPKDNTKTMVLNFRMSWGRYTP